MVAPYSLTPFTELRRQLDQLFDEFGFGRWRSPLMTTAYPLVNICDVGEELHVEAELPGVKKEDLEIFALGNELTIKGRWRPAAGDGQTRHRQERPSGEFSRVITLPVEVNEDKVAAELKDGVLSVRLPKVEAAKPRKIMLKS
ncbi:MAG: Hsp20/alpha crystallin family protein [Phycisphaerae bacterium]|nr:Hsp20/alpha crystallin family protein [Phycisphaerae bacterium]